MRRSVVALAGLVVVLGYVHRRADPDARVVAEVPTATAGVRNLTPPTHVTVVTPPSPILAAPPRTAPVLDLIDPDQEPPLPEAPPHAIHGRLVDIDGERAIGATVVVTSPNLEGEQVVITDEEGYFKITSLPVGEYMMTVYYNNQTFSHASLDVNDHEAAVVEDVLDPSDAAPEIEVVTANSEYGYNVPVPGRTFTAVLGSTAGSQGDSYGVSITGVTTLENVYVVDEANDEEQPPPAEVEPTRLEAPAEGEVDRGGM